ncbi:hypothetical protein QMK19_32215 [Streptomyces sp. H10-C2]|uniref:hypothetical protein n=1 Tax=unclassified Streptomyces TaxID=2593676 RepID=UPI0024B8EDB5|nr:MULTISPECIES: hypothetical protein [unclassified Streptomyces]MDJ0346411.1 hypothetical protein [Streptomyces sp. PH10-H1]MDJ0374174.1 hypothetical protein [Streptomyces sp. H10-C2]
MTRRRLSLTAAVLLLVLTPVTGCVTVHGEQALVPAVKKAEAAKALDRFTRLNNEAKRTYDPATLAKAETGALGAMDTAGLTARHANHPEGNPGYVPLKFTDARFLIPKQRGWPKWFAADAVSSTGGGAHWLLFFQRSAASDPWKASYLAVIQPDRMPQFVLDKDGYAQPVPLNDSALLVEPGRLSSAYTSYLQTGDAATLAFADGAQTSQVRQQRRKGATSSAVTAYADQPVDAGEFPPVGLRTKDGGALVFFASRHQSRLTTPGKPLKVDDPDTKALMTGTPKTSVTLVRVSEQAVMVPPADDATGKVAFLSRLLGLVTAKGE